jgi:hypothetical protein
MTLDPPSNADRPPAESSAERPEPAPIDDGLTIGEVLELDAVELEVLLTTGC